MSTFVILTDLAILTTLKDVTPLVITLFLMLAIHMIKTNMSNKFSENLPVTNYSVCLEAPKLLTC